MCETNHQRIYVLKTLMPSPSEDLEVQRQRLLSLRRLGKTGSAAVAPGKVLMKCDNCGVDLWRYPSQCLKHVYCPKCRHQDVLKTFWGLIDKTSSPFGCWLWIGLLDDGYGAINHSGFRRAHRLTWFLLKGEIPRGLFVLHRCPGGSNRRCCNPDHCYLGTKKDNAEDMVREGTFFSAPGEENFNAKVTNRIVSEIKRDYIPGKGGNKVQLASKYGLRPDHVYEIWKYTWLHVKPAQQMATV